MKEEFINDTNYFDQHFLIDKRVINTFIDNANLKITDDVVEIGPGKCQISEIIAKRVNHLTLIEIDEKLSPFINVLKDKYNNVDVIYGSCLDVYIPKCNKIISSLPYSITEPFIEKLLRCDFDEVLLIVGKRFADNVIDKSHNKLALLTNSFFNCERIIDIDKESFNPMPRVMSSMIKLTKINREELKENFKRFMFREMFFNRDRKLKNNLIESIIEFAKLHDRKLTKKESKTIVDGYSFPKEILEKKMENLSNSEYDLLYEKLK